MATGENHVECLIFDIQYLILHSEINKEVFSIYDSHFTIIIIIIIVCIVKCIHVYI